MVPRDFKMKRVLRANKFDKFCIWFIPYRDSKCTPLQFRNNLALLNAAFPNIYLITKLFSHVTYTTILLNYFSMEWSLGHICPDRRKKSESQMEAAWSRCS